VPQLDFLEVLLGDEPALSPQELFYQRLLAMDQEEARNIVEAQLKEKSPENLYQTVLIPALRLAEEDRHMDAFGERTSEFIYQSAKEIVDDLGDRITAEAAEEKTNADSGSVENRPTRTEIICLPARDEADELVGMMLAQTLRQAGYGATHLAIGTVNDMLEQVGKGAYRIACVSALPPFAVGQARSLCKRLRQRFPDLRILIGLWEFAGGVLKAQERVGENCANAVATSLSEGLLQIRRLSAGAVDNSEKSKNDQEDEPPSEAGTSQTEAATPNWQQRNAS
jgi:hypothetical protein